MKREPNVLALGVNWTD